MTEPNARDEEEPTSTPASGASGSGPGTRSKWAPLGVALAVLATLSIGLVAIDDEEPDPMVAAIAAEEERLAAIDRGPEAADGVPVYDAALSRAADTDDFGADTLSCLIEPHEIVDVGVSVPGVIESLPVERGDRVTRGQLIAQLEAKVEQAAVAVARARASMKSEIRAAEARAAHGESKSERALALVENQALADQLGEEIETEAELARRELERTKDLHHVAQLQLDQAEQVLGRRSIRSPIDGVVVDRMMSAGERVEDEPILRIAQIDPLRVEVILPAARFGEIQPSMRASIRPEIPGDEIHVAEVKVVDPMIDAASGTFRVQLELPNSDGAIPGGLHCDVRFARLEGP